MVSWLRNTPLQQIWFFFPSFWKTKTACLQRFVNMSGAVIDVHITCAERKILKKENEMKSPSFEDFHDDNPSIAWPFCLRVLLASQHVRKCCYFPGQWRQKTKVFFEFSTTLSNKNKCRHVAYMLQITYVVCRMQLLNLLHVPWKRNALLVFSVKVRGESLSSLDVEFWKENTDFRYISLLSKKATVCEFLFF